MIYNSLNKENSNYDVLHETLHFFGLSDRYTESKDNRGNRITIPNTGYENDIMGTGGKFDLSPNHYSNMYEFVMKQPAIQQNKYLKSFDGGDIRVDRIFSKGRNQGKGTLIR